MTQKHYIREWRRFRGLTQAQLGEEVGVSSLTIAKLESGVQPYTERYLLKMAYVFKCSPADLITRDPSQGESIWSLYEKMDEAQRKTAFDVIKAIHGGKS